MRRIRVIPVLLIHKGGLVKSVKFKNYQYIGDPINAVKIFNDKEVDEIVIIDIDAAREKRPPNFEMIADITGEAFMPLSYGGGITTIDEIKRILYSGVEKVIINSSAISNPALITEGARLFGSQSIVVSIDVKKNMFGKPKVYTHNGSVSTGLSPLEAIKNAEEAGCGEIILNSVDRDGTLSGYDTALIEECIKACKVPLIPLGGAADIDDLVKARQAGAAAVAAGSMFVFKMPHKAVLISYPDQQILKQKLFNSNGNR